MKLATKAKLTYFLLSSRALDTTARGLARVALGILKVGDVLHKRAGRMLDRVKITIAEELLPKDDSD